MLERRSQILEPFYRRYETVAVRIGLMGNGLFVAGSVLFMFSSGLPAKLCWLLGSIGMLVRAIGRLYADRRAEQEQFDGAPMADARRELDTAPE